MRTRSSHLSRPAIVVGAVALALGATPPSGATSATECPVDSTLVAKFEWADGYVYEKGLGAGIVTITNGTAQGGDWSSTVAITYVVVKGATDRDTDVYVPPAAGGTFDNGGLQVPHQPTHPDISHVLFCQTPVTTTSSSSTSTSTSTTTTTTLPTTTTTEAPSTTTTTAPPPPSTTTTTTPPPPSTTTTTEEAVVLPTSIVQEPTTTTSAAPTEVAGTQLARTGGPNGLLVLVGSLLIVQGVLFELAGRRVRRSS